MSTKKIVEYRVAQGNTANELAVEVERLIRIDFEPFGSVIVTPLYEQNHERMGQTFMTYAQAMVKRINDG